MRRFFLGLTSVLASASLMFGVASAASSNCSVVETGPNSNNTCNVTDSNNLKVTCKNNADVVFVNNQSTNSGNATIENNTNGAVATVAIAASVLGAAAIASRLGFSAYRHFVLR
jgi:hypothetical protein